MSLDDFNMEEDSAGKLGKLETDSGEKMDTSAAAQGEGGPSKAPPSQRASTGALALLEEQGPFTEGGKWTIYLLCISHNDIPLMGGYLQVLCSYLS